jgi:hypothetical protein
MKVYFSACYSGPLCGNAIHGSSPGGIPRQGRRQIDGNRPLALCVKYARKSGVKANENTSDKK